MQSTTDAPSTIRPTYRDRNPKHVHMRKLMERIYWAITRGEYTQEQHLINQLRGESL